MVRIQFHTPGREPQGVLLRIAAALCGVVVVAAAVMFSLAFFAVLAVVGFGLWLYFWWRTRALRALIRQQVQQGKEAPAPAAESRAVPTSAGEIIEGEAVRVEDDGEGCCR